MPSGGVLAIAALGAMIYFGGLGLYHKAKAAAHKIGCVIVRGKGCIK